jgi:hypothetical protein
MCEGCEHADAAWAWQEIDGENVFLPLGYHDRRRRAIPVCPACRQKIKAEGIRSPLLAEPRRPRRRSP